MDLKLTPAMLSTLQNALKTGASAGAGAGASAVSGLGAIGATGGAQSANSFSNALGDALKSVSQAQDASSDLQRKFQSGADGVSLEETMISMQKAQIGFQAALAVRNRLVSAYTDIMNMSV
jgi:flagellar hook-basal body complex protein FliE